MKCIIRNKDNTKHFTITIDIDRSDIPDGREEDVFRIITEAGERLCLAMGYIGAYTIDELKSLVEIDE